MKSTLKSIQLHLMCSHGAADCQVWHVKQAHRPSSAVSSKIITLEQS